MQTTRPELFAAGHFSVFDTVVHLGNNGDIDLQYHFDPEMDTHVIDSLNGEGDWWYQAQYDGGWTERNAFRMDLFPCKDRTTMRFFKENQGFLAEIQQAFRAEVHRKAGNGGKIIIPSVEIRGKSVNLSFKDVEVRPHDLRGDILRPGVVTAVDVIMTLADEGKLSYDLTWKESIGRAEVVNSYWMNRVDEDEAQGRQGFVYEVGPSSFKGTGGNHIHIPSDTRVLVSPEYEEWFWIRL